MKDVRIQADPQIKCPNGKLGEEIIEALTTFRLNRVVRNPTGHVSEDRADYAQADMSGGPKAVDHGDGGAASALHWKGDCAKAGDMSSELRACDSVRFRIEKVQDLYEERADNSLREWVCGGCSGDYILQYSRCIKQVEDAPNKMCPAGFELIDDEQCSQTVYSKPIPNCPDDYLFDNIVKRCYKVDVQYDFASVDTSVFRQNYTSTVQTGESSEREERSGDSETIKETFQSSSLPFQNQAPNYQGGRYPPFQRMLPPQTPSLPMRPPVQTLYPPQAYLQNGAYSNYGGVPSPMAQQNIGAAGYGYPFPGFQQYAPAPRLTNSPSYPVYMRSLSEENGEL
ncbi:oocyst wall protein 7 [Cryptosporidium canis]|nr:oocyst wall protein 7 [Cryptosporidium canis]